jgi:hypothetical protein
VRDRGCSTPFALLWRHVSLGKSCVQVGVEVINPPLWTARERGVEHADQPFWRARGSKRRPASWIRYQAPARIPVRAGRDDIGSGT